MTQILVPLFKGLGIVDGDDGGALRAALGEVCLRCGSFCAPEIRALV